MTGETKDTGWQVGARRTLPVELADAWDLLTSQPWLRRWSGLDTIEPDGLAGRSITAESVIGVRTPHSLVQLRVYSAVTGTTIAFHEDHLPDDRARTRRNAHWAHILDDLDSAVSAG